MGGGSHITRRLVSIAALGSLAAIAATPLSRANDAPLFARPFEGVPVPALEMYLRIVPLEQINFEDDAQRHLDVGGGPGSLPASLPPRFTDKQTTPSTSGMPAGGGYLGQFVDHDLTLTRRRFDELLIEPFAFRFFQIDGASQNRRVPGFDLDPVYRISPLEWPSTPDSLGPWDLTNLRFRFGLTRTGGLDFIRAPDGKAIIGDIRNDENGVIGQIHRAFMTLHNV